MKDYLQGLLIGSFRPLCCCVVVTIGGIAVFAGVNHRTKLVGRCGDYSSSMQTGAAPVGAACMKLFPADQVGDHKDYERTGKSRYKSAGGRQV